MSRIIRQTLPRNISFGIIIIIFVIIFFLSGQLFTAKQPNLNDFFNLYLAEFLVSSTVIIMIIILWEEILFPVKVKPSEEGMVLRNHRTKLWIQTLFYLVIPIIVGFLYINYRIVPFYFFSWAAVCIIAPVAGKLISGINNYNDFLKLTDKIISYKNNQKEGTFELKDISKIILIRDETAVLHKIKLEFAQSNPVTIDLDEMELDAYYEFIEEYIREQYKSLL